MRRYTKSTNYLGAVKKTVNGITFHSTAEARRYSELLLLQSAKKISELQTQVAYKLTKSGKTIGKYIPDFKYYDHDTGLNVVEEVKGHMTNLARWKIKHFEIEYIKNNPMLEFRLLRV